MRSHTLPSLLLAAGSALLLATACSRPDAQPQQEASGATVQPPPAAPAAAPAADLDDATIVAIFDAANTYDIETGGLAVRKSTNPEVKAMGENFVAAHTQVRQKGRDLAAKLGVTPTPPADNALGDAHVAAMANLRSLSGTEFDKAWLDHEIKFHQAVIDAVNTTLLPALDNAEVKALVEAVAPAFVAHMEGAKALRASMK